MDALQEKGCKVSVWLGHFDSEASWESYLEEYYEDDTETMNAFAADFDLGFFYDHDMQEANFTANDTPIEILLADNSYAVSFLAEVVDAADKAGIAAANVSLLLYDSVYQPSEAASNPRNRLHFVGVFSYVRS